MSGLSPIKPNASQEAAEQTNSEVEYVNLPSQGIFYTGQYKGLTRLKVRKLNWEDEDILTTRSYYDNGTLFNEILKGCIVDANGFKADMLVDIDKDAILWWLRINAFGQDYMVKKECSNPDCKHKQEEHWDLGGFDIPEVNPEFKEELEANGCIQITLPISKLKCSVAIPTIGRELELFKKLKNKKQKSNVTKDFNVTGKLISSIKEAYSLSGEKTFQGYDELLTWLRTAYNGNPIPLVDSRYIQRMVKEIDLSIDTKRDITCSNCGNIEEQVAMPISIGFFWPDFQE